MKKSKSILLSLMIMLLSISGCYLANGQTLSEAIEALKTQLKKETTFEKKAQICGDISFYYATLSADSSHTYGYRSLDFALKSGNDTLIAQAYNDLGTAYYLKGQYETAIAYCEKSLVIRKQLDDQKGIASLNVKMGNNYYKVTQYDSSMVYYLKAHTFFKNTGNELQQLNIESNISTVYQSLGNYQKAIEYLKRPIEFFEKNNDHLKLSNTLINLANIQVAQGDTLSAMDTYFKAEKVCEQGGNNLGLGALYNNLGEIYFYLKDWKNAQKYIAKSIDLRKSQGYDADLSSSYLTLGLSYFRLGNYTEAKPFLLKAFKGLEETNTYDKLSNASSLLISVYAYERKKDSLNYFYNKSTSLNHHMIQNEVRKLTQDIEERYQSAQKDKSILEQKQIIQQKELEIQKRTLWLVAFIALVLIISGFLFYQFKQKQAAVRQATLELKLAEQKELTRIQKERLRISRELHDNIGSYLTLISASVEQMAHAETVPEPSKISQLKDSLLMSMRELRKTVWLLNKQSISVDEIALRLRDFFKPLHQNGTKITVKTDGDTEQTLTEVQTTHLFRIIQEAISNAYKYAGCNQISVHLKAMDQGGFCFEVKDNGQGFDIHSVQNGNGLQNMRSRMAELNGQLKITSDKGDGTSVEGCFDLNNT